MSIMQSPPSITNGTLAYVIWIYTIGMQKECEWSHYGDGCFPIPICNVMSATF